MQDFIKQWPILSLSPMCTTNAGLSIISDALKARPQLSRSQLLGRSEQTLGTETKKSVYWNPGPSSLVCLRQAL